MKRDTTYHDGQMEVYRAASARNPQSKGDLTHVVTLLYNEAIPADTTLWVLIGSDLYSVQWVDKSPTTFYWYMERVRRIER